MDWKTIIGGIAPTVATALGGPLAGLAVEAVGKAIGMDQPTVKKVQDALTQGQLTSEQIVQLKAAEQALQIRMRELDISVDQIEAADRDSARKREIALNDNTPAILAGFVTLGFFGVLLWMLAYGIPQNGGDALLVMLGSLGTAWSGIIAYYYGSSRGSDAKTKIMAEQKGGV